MNIINTEERNLLPCSSILFSRCMVTATDIVLPRLSNDPQDINSGCWLDTMML